MATNTITLSKGSSSITYTTRLGGNTYRLTPGGAMPMALERARRQIRDLMAVGWSARVEE